MMIRLSKLVLMLAATAVGMLALPSTASAFTLSHLSSDEDYNKILKDNVFIAEGRIGNNRNDGDYELDIHSIEDTTGFTVLTQKDFQWTNGVAQSFSLAYDAVSKLVNYTVGDNLLTYTAENPLTDLFIRTRAARADSSIKVDNLFLNGVAIQDSSFAENSSKALDYLRISGVTDSFNLTGQSTMNWGAIMPTGSNLAYQIKAVSTTDSTSVPEPSATLGLTLGAIAFALKIRRQKQAA
ncbi:MAG: PEP-CTERM sorting domain-containing protein [Heteroscytonema crispum UTEX LB 1556]